MPKHRKREGNYFYDKISQISYSFKIHRSRFLIESIHELWEKLNEDIEEKCEELDTEQQALDDKISSIHENFHNKSLDAQFTYF